MFFLTQTKYTSRLKNNLSFFKVMGTVFIDFSFRLEDYLSWYITIVVCSTKGFLLRLTFFL